MTSGCIVIDHKILHENVISEILTPFVSSCRDRSLTRSRDLSFPRRPCFRRWKIHDQRIWENKERSNELTDLEKSKNQISKVTSRSTNFQSQTSSARHPYYSINFCPRQEKLYESFSRHFFSPSGNLLPARSRDLRLRIQPYFRECNMHEQRRRGKYIWRK